MTHCATLSHEQFTQTDPMPLGAGTAFENSYAYGRNNFAPGNRQRPELLDSVSSMSCRRVVCEAAFGGRVAKRRLQENDV